MCVDSCGGKNLTRAEVLAGIAGASVFAFGRPASAKSAPPKRVIVELPSKPFKGSPGAQRAFRIAGRSQLIRTSHLEIYELAGHVRGRKTRSNVNALLSDPVPTYAARLRDESARNKLREDLLDAKFIDNIDAIDAFLPSATNPMSAAAQPFFCTPGSAQDSHHAYPGGLVLHELFNARTALALARNYDDLYFGRVPTIDAGVVIAAALYHDIMKTVVFQWNTDGTLTAEPNLAGTGAHHVLSAAEAIVRGEDARFVTVVLSAHAAPSLGDEVKVAAWAQAAAMIAGVDPVDFGLLKKAAGKYELAQLPPIEAFINNLSDHDYVLSVHAMHEVAPLVDAHIAAANVPKPEALWHRNALLANTTAISLYQMLAKDRRAFDRRLDHDLSNLSA